MKIKFDYPLKSHNTLGLNVFASRFIEFNTLDSLRTAFKNLETNNWYVLGGGSNTLFTKNYSGTILHPTNNKILLVEQNATHTLIKADAGVVWDNFVEWTIRHNYFGAENLSYIPGSVGASAVQNIGAYGVEAKDIIHSVECYMVDEQKIQIIDNASCKFGYRNSIFKEQLNGKCVILSIIFKLSNRFTPILNYGNLTAVIPNPTPTALEVRQRVIAVRKSKLPEPKEVGNCGSFFKNPVVSHKFFESFEQLNPTAPHYHEANGVKIPAGWLIEQCGWKGKTVGEAGVHNKQALVIINLGHAKPQEIINLSQQIIADVKTKFSIDITPEVVFV